MRRLLSGLLRFLESARLVMSLLLFVVVWSVLATIVPQSGSAGAATAGWLKSQPLLWRVIGVLGLDRAFGAPLFVLAVSVLAISTGLCAWRRTRVAMGRMRLLDAARIRDASSIVERHDIEVPCDVRACDADSALGATSRALAGLGVKTRRRGDVLSSVSSPMSVWGSPVFHWGLLAIIVVILVGSLQRSEGLMGVPVGRSVPDAPDSYGVLNAGPLHAWGGERRIIRVDSFDKDYRAGGIDRGPTPSVSVLDAQGRVLRSQHIYPNSPLQIGSLTIHPAEWGFAVAMSLLDAKGTAVSTATKLVDVSQEAADGTVPLGALTLAGVGGQGQQTIVTTVPLLRQGGESIVPPDLTAHLVVTAADGAKVADKVLAPGESLALPSGLTLRVDDVSFYARLSVVDDGTIPFLYAAMALAVLGLALTVVSRQEAVLVTGREIDGTVRIFVSAHLWRNTPTSRDEIRDVLSAALHADKEDAS